jgi:hypothetical protein
LQSANQEIGVPGRKDIARFAGAPLVCHNVSPGRIFFGQV